MIKRFFSTLLITGILLAIAPSVYGQQLETYARQDSINSGDIIMYSIVLSLDTLYNEITFPDSSSFGEDLFIRRRQQFRINDLKDSLVYELQYFGDSDLNIDQLPVALSGNSGVKTLNTDPISIPFKTLLPDQDPQLRPAKSIFEFLRSNWPYILAFILLCVVAYFLYRYWRNNKDNAPPKDIYTPPPFYNPLHGLNEKLAQLQRHEALTRGVEFKAFYVSLGDALRAYFEELYQIPALESTSRELMRYLDAFGVEPSMVKNTRSVLSEADMVKFAKFTPTVEAAEKAYKLGLEFKDTARRVDSVRIQRMKDEHDAKYAPKPEPELETEEENAV